MSASLIGRVESSVSGALPLVWMSLAGSCFSPESALRPFHHGIRGRGGAIYGSALPAVRRQVLADMRSRLIHRPARDIFHRSVELEFPPIGFDASQLSCGCSFPGPLELGAVDPNAVHDDGQPPGQGHDRFLQTTTPGDLHRPGL